MSTEPYKKESHTRSLIKGLSWRVVATTDTVVVVAIVTSFTAAGMNLGHALQIGLYEFLIKYIVYYGHERVWENIRQGDGLEKSRTLKKAISWRIIATTMTFLISGLVLKSFSTIALSIAVVEFFSKFILYYLHERAWAKMPLGRIRNRLFRNKD